MSSYSDLSLKEQYLLKISVIVTFLLALSAVFIGFYANTSSVLFDGIYSAVDCFFSLAALGVTRLITLDVQKNSKEKPKFIRHFHHGFWHLEPIVLMINSASLVAAVLYGLIGSLQSLFKGGSETEFLPALIFAFCAMLVSFAMGIYQHTANKKIQSEFVSIDAKGWIISAMINGALLFAFVIGVFLEKTAYSDWGLYIDPLILTIITLVILPMPIKTLKKSLKGILLIAPQKKHQEVTEILQKIVKKYNFKGAYHYLAYVGRSLTIEVHIILPENYPITKVEFFDEIREELSQEIGEEGPDRWFTVSFTANEKWAI